MSLQEKNALAKLDLRSKRSHTSPPSAVRMENGPEPESVVVGEVGGTPLAFVALERIGGVVVYDVSDPTAPEFVQYLRTRVFDDNDAVVPDGGPEGMAFIPAAKSPTGSALLAVGNEVTGTVNLWGVVEG